MDRSFIVDGKKYRYEQIEESIDPIDLISFLDVQDLYPKMYWNERHSDEEKAAIGSVLSWEHVPNLEGGSRITLYGGKSFAVQRTSSHWRDFPPTFFFLPRFEIIQTKDQTLLRTYTLCEEGSYNETHLDWNLRRLPEMPYIYEQSHNTPSEGNWISLVEKALSSMGKTSFNKVVLARETALKTPSPINPYSLLRSLKEKKLNTTLFLLQLMPSSAFLGATPEKLYTRHSAHLTTEALAGTLPRGKTEEEDKQWQLLLESSLKERREVIAVEDYLIKHLKSYSSTVTSDPSYSTYKTPTVQHLYKKLSCTLSHLAKDKDLISYMHPTPAVGGLPKDKALAFLQEQEPFDRGWYAGPIGWMTYQAADFAVAIRSALITSRTTYLYAGTGIVEGSDPHKEWQELENKIAQYKDIFTCSTTKEEITSYGPHRL